MKYISLFTGIGGFEVAIHQLFPNAICLGYSEIDKNCEKIYKKHFPTHQNLGDITNINAKKLKGKIDLLVGGSPCQDFSTMNINTKNSGLEGSKSKLFFHFLRILKESQPRYFILENVKMKQVWRDVISSHLNVSPVEINSNTVSAQNRSRLYWTNLPIQTNLFVSKNIVINDILEERKDKEEYKMITFDKQLKQYISSGEKGPFVKINCHTDSKTNTLTTDSRFYVYYEEDNKKIIYKLTPLERERLQTFPENWTSDLSTTMRYKVVGNAVTCDVIKELVKFYKPS